jgi:hypothetical protein
MLRRCRLRKRAAEHENGEAESLYVFKLGCVDVCAGGLMPPKKGANSAEGAIFLYRSEFHGRQNEIGVNTLNRLNSLPPAARG